MTSRQLADNCLALIETATEGHDTATVREAMRLLVADVKGESEEEKRYRAVWESGEVSRG